jgi:hypothetical protein
MPRNKKLIERDDKRLAQIECERREQSFVSALPAHHERKTCRSVETAPRLSALAAFAKTLDTDLGMPITPDVLSFPATKFKLRILLSRRGNALKAAKEQTKRAGLNSTTASSSIDLS